MKENRNPVLRDFVATGAPVHISIVSVRKWFFYLPAFSSLFRAKLNSFFITGHRVCGQNLLGGFGAGQPDQISFTCQTAEQLCCGLLTLVHDRALNLLSKMVRSYAVSLQS